MTKRYVALLRGINVGAANQVAMSDLQRAFASYSDVATLLRSGNVVFSAESFTAADRLALEGQIAEQTGVAARVLVLAGSTLRQLAEANPLLGVATDHSRLVTTFLDGDVPQGIEPPAASVLAPEQLVVAERAIYQWCPDGISKSKVPASFWRALGPVATARNQRTIERLIALV